MSRVERICPECGASNAYNKTRCVKCRAPLTALTGETTPPPPLFTRRGMARLTWRASVFLTRLGIQYARTGARRGLERWRKRDASDVRNETIDGTFTVQDDEATELLKGRDALEGWRGTRAAPQDDSSANPITWGPKK